MRTLPLIMTASLAIGVCMADDAPQRVRNAVHGVVCSLPDDPFGYFGWPSITKQDDGTLCVVASGLRQGHVCPWGRTTICKSRDNGKTWSYPKVINNTPLDDRDAGIVNLGGKRLAVTWFTSNTWQIWRNQKNPDGTWKNWVKPMADVFETWTPELLKRELDSWIRVSEDGEYWGEPRRAPVNTPHGFIVLKDGSWLYFGKRWLMTGEGVMWTMRGDTEICAARSTDEGRNWEMLGNVPRPEGVLCEQCHEPHAIELPDGSLLGVVRVEQPFRTMVTRSNDGGKTWSVMEDVGAHGAPPHLLRHSSGAIICVYGYRQAPFGQRCMISNDNGKTWKTDIIIRDDGPNGDLGYPASVELSDGSILTIYYQYLANQSKASILWTRWNLPEEGDGKINVENLVENEFEVNRRYFFNDCECRVIFAPDYDPKSGKVALTFSGRGNTPVFANVDSPDAVDFRRKVLAEGYMIIIPFCGGNSWGSVDATTTALKSLEHLEKDAGFAIPQKMPVFGYSMGGLAALMFAVRHPERVSKVVDFFGAIDLADMAKRNAAFAPVINGLYPDEAALQAASPLNYGKILAQFPIRIYHGDKDQGVPMSYSTRLEAVLKENGGKVDLVVVPGIGHENAIMKYTAESFLEFLKK